MLLQVLPYACPLKPALQAHLYDPPVSVQMALVEHRWLPVTHSSILLQIVPINAYPALHWQWYEPFVLKHFPFVVSQPWAEVWHSLKSNGAHDWARQSCVSVFFGAYGTLNAIDFFHCTNHVQNAFSLVFIFPITQTHNAALLRDVFSQIFAGKPVWTRKAVQSQKTFSNENTFTCLCNWKVADFREGACYMFNKKSVANSYSSNI